MPGATDVTVELEQRRPGPAGVWVVRDQWVNADAPAWFVTGRKVHPPRLSPMVRWSIRRTPRGFELFDHGYPLTGDNPKVFVSLERATAHVESLIERSF